MKAYNRLRPVAIATLAAAIVLTGSCSEPPIEPSPPPAPAPVPTPAPPPPLPSSGIDWRTMPITPGDWQWSDEGGRSTGRFAEGLIVLTCDRQAGQVTLIRSGAAHGPVAMTIHTSSTTRPVTGASRSGPSPAIAVNFRAGDPILDAMAFSRGRFAVETAGHPTLFVPSWPEVSRVIEDCR